MSARQRSSRFVLWTAVFALLLKGAVPMFAALAARLQGVSVAEVCTVYGVALPNAVPHDAHAGHAHHAHMAGHAGHEDHSNHDRLAHSGDHCALTALAALAPPDAGAGFGPATVRESAGSPSRFAFGAIPDAAAVWAARLEHGPPRIA